MANKTYLEMAAEIVTAMVNKGYIRVQVDKSKSWKEFNRESCHTVGWAILEMYRELAKIPQLARQPEVKPEVTRRIVKP